MSSRVVTITDPDEAVRLFRAGLLVFNYCGDVRPLARTWTVNEIATFGASGGCLAMLIEEDDSLTEEEEQHG